MSESFSPLYRFGQIQSFPKQEAEVSILVGKSKDLYIDSRIPGQTVRFVLWESSNLVEDKSVPVVILVYGFGKSSKDLVLGDTDLEESSLGSKFYRDGYTIIVPFLFSDPVWVLKMHSLLQYTDSSLEEVLVAKLQAILDYVDQEYPASPVLIYGEDWGSVLARELGVLDSRVDLVITNKFSGDPIRLLRDKGVEILEESQWMFGVLGDSSKCTIGQLGSFIRLSPTPQIIVRESGTVYDYSLGALVSSLITEYLKVGAEDKVVLVEDLENVHSLVQRLLDLDG